MKAIIVDMDGTLELRGDRVALAETGDWAAWHKNNGNGPPNEAVVELCRVYAAAGYKILIATARQECFRKVTELWLTFNGVPWAMMWMRTNDDRRKDEVVKREMLHHMRECGFEINLAVDDRSRVVAMWREAGLTCFQVAEWEELENVKSTKDAAAGAA